LAPGLVFGHMKAGNLLVDCPRLVEPNDCRADQVLPPSTDRENLYVVIRLAPFGVTPHVTMTPPTAGPANADTILGASGVPDAPDSAPAGTTATTASVTAATIAERRAPVAALDARRFGVTPAPLLPRGAPQFPVRVTRNWLVGPVERRPVPMRDCVELGIRPCRRATSGRRLVNHNFSQMITVRCDDGARIIELLAEWDLNQATSDIMGYMGTRVLADRENIGQYIVIADFGVVDPKVSAADEAARNNTRPETRAFAAQLLEVIDGEPEYHHFDEIYRTDR
jgi:hypothetical protein